MDSQLQPDPNDETHALLRILIYKIDNNTFGSTVPTLPNWTGPPRAITDVQAILYASLAISLFSAFLAMLGKQWLNRYDSADMRGTVVERSQNRQRKLDGIVAWYFDNVMELLPLMLQGALLLFGCALSRYLWEIDMTIASVVLGVTSFGALSYFFIMVAGTVFENCPYQTPGAHILRHHLLPPLRSTPPRIFSKFTRFVKTSSCYRTSVAWWGEFDEPWYSISNIRWSPVLIFRLPIALLRDIYHLGRAIPRLLVALSRTMYHRLMATSLSLRTQDLGRQTTILDLRCVSWMLQTSLDKTSHLTALQYLMTMAELACSDPSLILSCFNIFISSVNVIYWTPVMVQGMERLAEPSATFFLRTFHHLLITDPTSNTLVNLRRRYRRVFSLDWVDFMHLPIRYTMFAAHILVNPYSKPPEWWTWFKNDRPSGEEHIQLAWCIAEAAMVRPELISRVPRWTLRFAWDSLSLDPPPPPSAVVDCLTIIAFDLDCDLSNITTPDEDEGYVMFTFDM